MTWVMNFALLLSLIWLALSTAIAIVLIVAVLTAGLIERIGRRVKTRSVVPEAERILRERSR